MSPSIASIVTPFNSPAVLSMSSSFLQVSRPRGFPSAWRLEPAALLHARGKALLLVLPQLFLRVELLAALLALEQFHGVPPLLLRYFVSGAGPVSFSASSTVTRSPFFTF